MKKIFLFIMAAFTIVSCSQDNDVIHPLNNDTGQNIPVTMAAATDYPEWGDGKTNLPGPQGVYGNIDHYNPVKGKVKVSIPNSVKGLLPPDNLEFGKYCHLQWRSRYGNDQKWYYYHPEIKKYTDRYELEVDPWHPDLTSFGVTINAEVMAQGEIMLRARLLANDFLTVGTFRNFSADATLWGTPNSSFSNTYGFAENEIPKDSSEFVQVEITINFSGSMYCSGSNCSTKSNMVHTITCLDGSGSSRGDGSFTLTAHAKVTIERGKQYQFKYTVTTKSKHEFTGATSSKSHDFYENISVLSSEGSRPTRIFSGYGTFPYSM